MKAAPHSTIYTLLPPILLLLATHIDPTLGSALDVFAWNYPPRNDTVVAAGASIELVVTLPSGLGGTPEGCIELMNTGTGEAARTCESKAGSPPTASFRIHGFSADTYTATATLNGHSPRVVRFVAWHEASCAAAVQRALPDGVVQKGAHEDAEGAVSGLLLHTSPLCYTPGNKLPSSRSSTLLIRLTPSASSTSPNPPTSSHSI